METLLLYLAVMLRVNKLNITHFKNYGQESYEFCSRIVCLAGPNGVGKTNLLDAIYYCCFTKSYFTSQDQMNISWDKQGFRLEGFFNLEGKDQKIVTVHRGQGKKEFSLNDIPYPRLSKHIGQFPAVIIAPDDAEIITGASELRRKYMDTLLCQVNPEYLQQLMLYNKVLQQRNSLLRNSAGSAPIDYALLDVLDLQLIPPGEYIFQQRRQCIPVLVDEIHKFYGIISGSKDKVDVEFESALDNMSFPDLLKQNIGKDTMLQRTSQGIHRDDLILKLDGHSFKAVASQGQRKSLLFALKLAEHQLLHDYKNFAPILLLDDVFEKLDENRIRNLLGWVCTETNSQVFITDTDAGRLSDMFDKFNITPQIFSL